MGNGGASAEVINDNGTIACKVIFNDYNSAVIIPWNFYGRMTLGEMDTFYINAFFASGDITDKEIYIYAYDSLPTGTCPYDKTNANFIGSYTRNLGVSTEYEMIEIDISGNGSTLNDEIYIAIGFNAGGTDIGSSEDTVWYLEYANCKNWD